LGIHQSTVSRALGRHPGIPEATRSRVKAKAEAMGYRPDPMLRSLQSYSHRSKMKRKVATVALLIQHETLEGWTSYHTGQSCYEGIQKRARELGFEIEPFCLPPLRRAGKKLDKILRARGIRAVLLAGAPQPSAFTDLDWTHYAGVALGYATIEPALHRVVPHYRFAVKTVVQELRRLGYRRIALAYSPEDEQRLQDGWTSGFLLEQSRAQSGECFGFFQQNFVHTRSGYFAGLKEFQSWFESFKPDVVLSATDDAHSFLVKFMKLTLLKDVGYVHLARPPGDDILSGIDQRLDVIGAAAVDMLGAMVHQNEYGLPEVPKVVVIEGKWVQGRTVGPHCTE
jgi:LacI family transcriptional regulator